jgi:hypothetical protein
MSCLKFGTKGRGEDVMKGCIGWNYMEGEHGGNNIHSCMKMGN